MRHAFDAALENAERQEEAEPPRPPPSIVASLPASEAPAPSGSHSLWDMAAEWTPEADPPPPPPEPPPSEPPPSERVEDIAAELNLAALRTPADLARARRQFNWRNHPDRCRHGERDLANRRVALANMLLDRELERFGRPTPRRR